MRRALTAGGDDARQGVGRYAPGEDVVERASVIRAARATDPAGRARVGVGAAPLGRRRAAGAAANGVWSAIGATSPAQERLLTLRRTRDVDWSLLLAVVCLCAVGLLMVFSASQAIAPSDPWLLLRRQGLSLTLGALALVVTARVDYHRWGRLAAPAFGLAVALVALTLLIGRSANGAQRWLGGSFSVQPSEPAKLALALALASWFGWIGPAARTARWGLLPWLGATGVLAALTLAQRDMGTTVVIIALAFAIYFTAGARPAHLLALLAGGALTLGALALAVSYRRARLAAFLDPLPPGCRDASSYQVCQGLLSLGTGGPLGAGLGASVQKAGYLPFPQTDSIFAVLGGELGLLGCALTISLLAVVVWRGYRAGQRAPDTFGALLACGLTTWLVAQAAINVGSVVAAIPFTGVPLPFISYGGAALVSEMAAVGMLLNIAAQGAPLRKLRAARTEQTERAGVTVSLGSRDERAEYAELPAPAPMAGMPLATSQTTVTTWTANGIAPLAQTLGEEHPYT